MVSDDKFTSDVRKLIFVPGVIWLAAGPILNAEKGFNLLQNSGKQLRFISNNAYHTDESYITKFQKLGLLNLTGEDFIYPTKPILDHLEMNKEKYKKIFIISGSHMRRTIKAAGFNIFDLVN